MNFRDFNRTTSNRKIRACRTLSLTLAAGSTLLLAACATSDGPRTFIEPFVGVGVGISELDLEMHWFYLVVSTSSPILESNYSSQILVRQCLIPVMLLVIGPFLLQP